MPKSKTKPTNQTMPNKPTNPFGNYGDAVQPRAQKHKGVKAKAVCTLTIAPQDNEEWSKRVTYVDNALNAIDAYVSKNKDVKFIKRRFFLTALESHIAKYLADNPDCIIK